jgi:YggT family protein
MIAEIVNVTITVLIFAIIGRAILSWFPNINPYNPFVQFLNGITDPILAPIRSVMPRGIMIDFSPMIAIFVLVAIRSVLLSGLQ